MVGIFAKNILYFASANGGQSCDPNQGTQYSFFGFPHWWQYIHTGTVDVLGNCTPKVVVPNGLWAIGFAVVDMLLYAAGLVAVFSIIAAGFQYLAATGNVEDGRNARKRFQNSLIGLVIVIIAAPLVSFIGYKIG